MFKIGGIITLFCLICLGLWYFGIDRFWPREKALTDRMNARALTDFGNKADVAEDEPDFDKAIKIREEAVNELRDKNNAVAGTKKHCATPFRQTDKRIWVDISECDINTVFPLESTNIFATITYEGHLYYFAPKDKEEKLETELEKEVGRPLQEMVAKPVLRVQKEDGHSMAEQTGPGTYATRGFLKYVVETRAHILELVRK